MKRYPEYDKSVEVRGRKFTVTVRAASQCGPHIAAKAATTIRPGDTLERLERDMLPIAVRNLGYEHDDAESRCKAAGNHRRHQ